MPKAVHKYHCIVPFACPVIPVLVTFYNFWIWYSQVFLVPSVEFLCVYYLFSWLSSQYLSEVASSVQLCTKDPQKTPQSIGILVLLFLESLYFIWASLGFFTFPCTNVCSTCCCFGPGLSGWYFAHEFCVDCYCYMVSCRGARSRKYTMKSFYLANFIFCLHFHFDTLYAVEPLVD